MKYPYIAGKIAGMKAAGKTPEEITKMLESDDVVKASGAKVADFYPNGWIFISTATGNTTIGGPLHTIEPYDDPENPGREIYQMGAIGPNPVMSSRPKRKVKRKKTV